MGRKTHFGRKRENVGRYCIIVSWCGWAQTSNTGTANGHQWVDPGLSVKWATTNVGATNPENYGFYFAWGETSPKSSYSPGNLKYCTLVDFLYERLSKYNTDSSIGTVDNKTRLDLSDDAARANWGGRWRMPTKEEIEELLNKYT